MVRNGMGMTAEAKGMAFPLGPRRAGHNKAVKRAANVRRRRAAKAACRL